MKGNITTIVYNMKGHLTFSLLYFSKFTYGLLPLQQHPKIQKEKEHCVAGFYICVATQSRSKSWYIISLSQSGFLLRILWCIQNGDHPENNLAKFGYILDMKVGKKQKPPMFLATYKNLWKSGDLNLFLFKI